MHIYSCNRCGRQYGSHSAIKMHLRNVHFNKTVCEKCGKEVYEKQIQAHLNAVHLSTNSDNLALAISNSKYKQKRLTDNLKEESFWEVPDDRLPNFIAPGTNTKCRLCGIILGGIHGREQHERDAHRYTTQMRNSVALRFTTTNILDTLQRCDVKDYVQEVLKPRLSGTPDCNQEVNVLVDFLIEDLPLNVTQVIRGGSYGKGTCLKGHSDLDMVVFMERWPLFGANKVSANRLSACLQEIKLHLQRSLLATRVLFSEMTNHALRFQYKCYKNDHIHHIDVMPCNDLLGPTPTAEDKRLIYELIAKCKNQHQLQMLNTCLLQLQVEFIRHRPSIVHNLIRLVKHWKRSSFGKSTSFNRHRRLPNSYSLELITIYAWETHGKPILFDLTRGLAAVLQILVSYENLRVAWYHNYTPGNKWLKETLQRPTPVLIDPANPLNNVCDSSNCWDEIAYVAQQSLKKPLFKGIRSTKNWT